ncbi:hypothetical protein ASPCAL12655 [Aspergillus calidoustus]|uniref:Uncharacterized protein n=1 Tax=Aspergillus calidoustus TaxID=454130 RepID=A0A0U5GCZ6_ASPCI|nr:hypothetical protein ASPCAL12655 [Aspergillus calidoustus]
MYALGLEMARCILAMQRGHSKERIGALSGKSKCWRDGTDSAEHMPPSELDDIPQATLQQQIAVLATSCFPQTSITGRSRPDDRAPIGHDSGEQRLHKNVVDGDDRQRQPAEL